MKQIIYPITSYSETPSIFECHETMYQRFEQRIIRKVHLYRFNDTLSEPE